MKYWRTLLLLLIALTLLAACGRSKRLTQMPLDDRINHAMELYNKGKYYDARTQFQIIVLNNPGSRVVDMAQYYLGECFFNMKEYITAAAEFEKLIRLYPRSQYVDNAQYRIGVAYYELSPKSSLDQTYTYKAIDALQQFLEDFPESELVPDATTYLQRCRLKLAKKEFETGEHYRRTNAYVAAIISFDEVLRSFFDTKYAEDAYYWKAYCHYKIDELDKARASLQVLSSKFPNTSYKQRAKNLARLIEQREEKQREETAFDDKKAQQQY